jgi:hypothetical protein
MKPETRIVARRSLAAPCILNSPGSRTAAFKRYWLRVPPDMTTARKAVAWTFNVPVAEYAPVKET